MAAILTHAWRAPANLDATVASLGVEVTDLRRTLIDAGKASTQNLYGRSDLNQGDADGATNSRPGAAGTLGNGPAPCGTLPCRYQLWLRETGPQVICGVCCSPGRKRPFRGLWKGGSAWIQALRRRTSR